MTTFYTSVTKQILRDDIVFIDEQLTYARNKMAEGDKAEAWSTLDGLLGYYDFKKHFPDIFVNEGEYIRFLDMYDVLRDIDDIIEIDAIQILAGGNPLEWRPGYSREEILRRIEAFLDQIERWQALNWFEGDEILDSLELLKEKIRAFIRFFQNYTDEYLFKQVIEIRDAKKRLWRLLSDNLPFAEIYEHLLTMDRDLTYLVFRFRLHLEDVTPDEVESVCNEIAEKKHAILAIINATRAGDEVAPLQPPPGWDDLQPFPPPGYALIGTSIVPIRASRRRNQGVTLIAGSMAAIDIGNAAKSREFMTLGLFGLVFGAIVVSVLGTLWVIGNCTAG
jgi:hypothetical protein